MAFGEAAFGEAAFGQGVGAVAGGAVDGVMHIIETPDIFSIIGNVPVISSVSAVADPNMLIIVVELELGVFS